MPNVCVQRWNRTDKYIKKCDKSHQRGSAALHTGTDMVGAKRQELSITCV